MPGQTVPRRVADSFTLLISIPQPEISGAPRLRSLLGRHSLCPQQSHPCTNFLNSPALL